jgi:hypothetical protein
MTLPGFWSADDRLAITITSTIGNMILDAFMLVSSRTLQGPLTGQVVIVNIMLPEHLLPSSGIRLDFLT